LTLLTLLALIVSFAGGFFAVSLLWPQQVAEGNSFILRCSLAGGFGLGISSFLFFIWLRVAGTRNAFASTFVAPEVVVTACLGYLYYRRTFRASKIEQHSAPVDGPKFWTRVLAATFCLVLLFAVASFIYISLRIPHGEYDATSIWNLRARFLARGTSQWRNAFVDSLGIPHPDYPLLQPGAIARVWKYVGQEPLLVPILAAFLFTFSTVGLISSSLGLLRSSAIGYLGGIVLLGVNSFVPLGASQYADTAVGFFILAAIVLTAFYDASPTRNNIWFLVLAGAAAGFCAWTKNEGQLFLVLFLLVRLSSTLSRQGWRLSAREAAAVVAGLLPALVVLAYFKLAVIPENYYLLAGTHTSGPMQNFLEPGTIHQKLVDVSRYRLIAKTMANQIIHFGARSIGITAFLALYVLVMGVTKKSVVSVYTGIGLLVLMMAGYFAVYLTTPLNLAFQLQTSLSRLLLQLWPSAVFVLFMATSSTVHRSPARIATGVRAGNSSASRRN
jgi:hypothetical protein